MIDRIAIFGKMIKFSHTVFALPFAFASVILASHEVSVTSYKVFWILMAMVGARSAAMGYNRIADCDFDSKNPRTYTREIPSGRISKSTAFLLVVLFSILFTFSSAMLSWLCFYLSWPVLAILFFYSHTKRFTYLSHIVLGFGISLAPIGAWIAVTGNISPGILLLSLALLTHIAGFDILYACQDIDFDRESRLYSIPVKFGPRIALRISSAIHIVTFISLLLVFFIFEMGNIYLISTFIIGILLIWEHKLVNPSDLSKVDVAFFHINSIVSVVLFLGVSLDGLIRVN